METTTTTLSTSAAGLQTNQAQIIPYRSEYGGCKSWIDLAEPVSIASTVPVLNDTTYTHLVAEIRRIVGNCYAPSILRTIYAELGKKAMFVTVTTH